MAKVDEITFSYTGTRRRWIVPAYVSKATITYELKGAGGGGGGNDSHAGGAGAAGSLVTGSFDVKGGDIIDVGVGGAGAAGSGCASGAAGGSNGQSLTNYVGGTGGRAGGGGCSGGGGGGGGATVILVNEKPVAIAAGGGGGGGGGNHGGGAAANSTPAQGQVSASGKGENGADHVGDGGGGGGAGGGHIGGKGGDSGQGDVGGAAGYTGFSLGDNKYPGNGNVGGAATAAGTSGSAYLKIEANPKGLYKKTENRFYFSIGGRSYNYYTQKYWENVKDVFHKDSTGTWKKVTQLYRKVNGKWEDMFFRTGLKFDFDSSTTGWGGAGEATTATSHGGGGGGGCKIICTKLHELGYLPDDIYAADEKFGHKLRAEDPRAYFGYVRWAATVVDWMSGTGWFSKLTIACARLIATPWANHMAYVMGVREKDSVVGKALMKVGLFVSRFAGRNM
jgi:hypothetical protein